MRFFVTIFAATIAIASVVSAAPQGPGAGAGQGGLGSPSGPGAAQSGPGAAQGPGAKGASAKGPAGGPGRRM